MRLKEQGARVYHYLTPNIGLIRHKWIHITVGIIVFAVMGLSPAYYFYRKYTLSQKLLENPSAVAEEKTKELLKKVGTHVQLPGGEVPRVATVSNKEKLAGQQFFDKAENGDKVLIFETAKRAYLYRPSADKVINVAPIIDPISQIEGSGEGEVAAANTGTSSAAAATAVPEPTLSPSAAPVSVAIYNGTATNGLARKMGAKIQEIVPSSDTTTANASDTSYPKTIIVDVDGKHKDMVKQLAARLEADVAALPPGESLPDSSILIIVGAENVLE